MPTDDGDVDRLLTDLARWAAESLTAQEAGSRSREAWLRQQAADDTSMEALLIGWAERSTWVRLTTVGGGVNRGRIVAVGHDFVLLSGDGDNRGQGGSGGHHGRALLVRTSAIMSIARAPAPGEGSIRRSDGSGALRFETAPSRRLGPTDQPGVPDASAWLGQTESEHTDSTSAMTREIPSPRMDLAGVLAGLAAERPRLRITAGLNSSLVGELRWVGSDVACISLDGAPPTAAYVRLSGVIEVSILDP